MVPLIGIGQTFKAREIFLTQAWVFLFCGFGFLAIGAEILVRGASKLARAWGVSPLAIGLTIVAFGTSAPELLVNAQAIMVGKDDIALGNIIGSNILNVLFILGICAVILPLKVVPKLVKLDVPVMIFASGLMYVFCLDLKISRVEGLIFLSLILLYVYYSFVLGKTEPKVVIEEYDQEFGGDIKTLRKPLLMMIHGLMIVAGLGLLSFGAKWLVESGVVIARAWGMSEMVIGVTIIAVGTSLPEMATSISATLKGERDIAIGNVVGSNIYNILLVGGVLGIIPARGFLISPSALVFDIPFMCVVALMCYPVFRSQNRISRWEGTFMFMTYIGYMIFLIQKG
ncbi:MAG: calcium/sodium antiporter [Candidatus Omnitrophica bacterium]|nr:calcium/sodium antiporter [Candidatus Omnitrophota bacterium]